MTGKKALDRIETNYCVGCWEHNAPCDCPAKRDFDIIKEDLDRLEKLEKENTKLKKIIQIIKETLSINIFVCDDPEYTQTGYVIQEKLGYNDLEFEEYELLKEVFEDGRVEVEE